MANHKSAAKRARQTTRRSTRNGRTRNSVRTLEKKIMAAIQSKKSDEAKKMLVDFTSAIDKAAQKGVVHVKRAARRVSRLSKQIQSL